MAKEIHFDSEHRKKHFAFFNAMAQPHFSICANVDITFFRDFIKRQQLDFTPAIVYQFSAAANDVSAFRQRIRTDILVEHDVVHPSFSVTTEKSDVFSFCEVPFRYDFEAFYQNTKQRIVDMQQNPSFEDEHGRDDFLFLSAIPWVSFTGLTHAMHSPVQDSVPRITWGKYFFQGDQWMMPVSVQVHHAVVDGRHVGQYFQILQSRLNQPF